MESLAEGPPDVSTWTPDCDLRVCFLVLRTWKITWAGLGSWNWAGQGLRGAHQEVQCGSEASATTLVACNQQQNCSGGCGGEHPAPHVAARVQGVPALARG